jgi:hypothetical protein
MIGQHVRYLDAISRFPQVSGCRLPARCTDQRSCHKNEIQTPSASCENIPVHKGRVGPLSSLRMRALDQESFDGNRNFILRLIAIIAI